MDREAWGAEYDEPAELTNTHQVVYLQYDELADLTTTHQVVNIHRVEQLVQGMDWSEGGP